MNNFSHIATKFHKNKILLLALLTAFISMQWSTAHIHLADHHDHDGSHHQHNVKAHEHQSISFDDEYIETTHQVDDHNVNIVELDLDCNTTSAKKLDNQPVTLLLASLQLNIFLQEADIKPAKLNESKHQYLSYSTINLRAPPKLS